MFVRTEIQSRLVSSWKSIHYINMSNVLRLKVEKNTVSIYTVFRPQRSAFEIKFDSQAAATKFVEQTLNPTPRVERLDGASADPLALQAMADWEEEQKLK